jgi:predicted membrane metal-binding protein
MFILLIIAILTFSVYAQLLHFTAPISDHLQFICISSLNSEISHSELLSAFVCGKSLPPGELRELWTTTGLYHLLVVSGSHLIFLMSIWELLRSRVARAVQTVFANAFPNVGSKTGPQIAIALTGVEVVLLVTFALMTGFQAPVVRSLFARLLQSFNQLGQWGWPKDLCVLGSGVLCLLLFPDWVRSRSLILSWMAALALTQGRTALQKSALVFLFTAPCLWGWGQLNPATILVNLMLVPPLSALLLVSSLLSWSFPTLCELGLKLVVEILQQTSKLTPTTATSQPLDLAAVWAYLIIVTAALHFQRVSRRRTTCRFAN